MMAGLGRLDRRRTAAQRRVEVVDDDGGLLPIDAISMLAGWSAICGAGWRDDPVRRVQVDLDAKARRSRPGRVGDAAAECWGLIDLMAEAQQEASAENFVAVLALHPTRPRSAWRRLCPPSGSGRSARRRTAWFVLRRR